MGNPLFVAENKNPRSIAVWLLICCALVLAMVVLGGYTRLTHSGLSMVDWEPLMGIIPPLSEQAWLRTFEEYQQYPEYQQINKGMELEGFKSIYLVEYAHRVLGRLVGFVFLLPFLFFLLSRRMTRRLFFQCIGFFLLGGLQGLIGWYMVKSGLVADPHVSHYRLTLHLITAVVIFGVMFWVALRLLDQARQNAFTEPGRVLPTFGATVFIVLIALMVMSGGMVAGSRAGFIYNTFPLMGDAWLPSELWAMSPLWLNIFENPVTMQFLHRYIALLILVCALIYLWRIWSLGETRAAVRGAISSVLVLLFLQVVLGISTLLLKVPTALAVLHQGIAVCLFAAFIYLRFSLGRYH